VAFAEPEPEITPALPKPARRKVSGGTL
jgi:hypothetical protein